MTLSFGCVLKMRRLDFCEHGGYFGTRMYCSALQTTAEEINVAAWSEGTLGKVDSKTVLVQNDHDGIDVVAAFCWCFAHYDDIIQINCAYFHDDIRA